jgi:FixJ family two-component response regulator
MDVLVVEDDDGVRENLAEFLADSGFQVEQAESAEDGLVLMEGCGLPGVLVTDLDLGPGIGGLALAQTIAERWRAIPVIFISGRPWLLQFHPLGPRERFLAKPFLHNNLMQVINLTVSFFHLPTPAVAADSTDTWAGPRPAGR